jgi:hypothetical protein
MNTVGFFIENEQYDFCREIWIVPDNHNAPKKLGKFIRFWMRRTVGFTCAAKRSGAASGASRCWAHIEIFLYQCP